MLVMKTHTVKEIHFRDIKGERVEGWGEWSIEP